MGARYHQDCLISILTRNTAALKIKDTDNVQKILRKQTADIYDDTIEDLYQNTETGENNKRGVLKIKAMSSSQIDGLHTAKDSHSHCSTIAVQLPVWKVNVCGRANSRYHHYYYY